MKKLAANVRKEHKLTTSRVLPSDLKIILKAEGVSEIVLFPGFKNLRGMYYFEGKLPIVAVKKDLPRDPYAFTLGHELKHHLVDQHLLSKDFDSMVCTTKNQEEMIEIGAEVFSAELLYPEELFLHDIFAQGVGSSGCKPEDLVYLKKATDTTLSYSGLAKRATLLRLVTPGSLDNIPWKKLEEEIFGEPIYKQWANRKKAR